MRSRSASRMSAAAGALLLVMALPTIMAQTSGPSPDLAVTDVRVLGALPQWIEGHATPGSAFLQVTIRNIGNAPSPGYRVDYSWVAEGGAPQWLNGQEAQSFDVADAEAGPLDAGESRTLPAFNWTLQPGQSGVGAIRAALTPVGPDKSLQNDRRDRVLFVKAHDVDLDILGGTQAMHDARETRFVRVEVSNRGNVPETVPLQLLSGHADPPDRLADLRAELQESSLRVEPNEAKSSTLFVDYAFSGATGAFTAIYDVKASTAYGVSLTAATPAFTSSPDELAPGEPSRVVRTDTTPLFVPRLGSLTLGLRVTNVGSSPDVYVVAPVTQAGWTAAVGLDGLVDQATARLGLMPGEGRDVRLTLRAPADAVAGTPTEAGLAVRSNRPADPNEAVWPVHVKGPSLRLEPAEGLDLEPYQGDPIEVPVLLANDGDAATPQDLQVRLVVSGAEAGAWTQPVDSLAEGTQGLTRVATGQTHKGQGPVTLVIDQQSPGGAIYGEPLRLEGFVHAPAAVLAPALPGSGVPGQTVGYRTGTSAFKVTNTGNTDETFRASARADLGDVVFVTAPVFTLAKGETRTIALDHRLPVPTGSARQANVSLSISILERPGFSWTAKTATQVVDVLPPQVAPLPFPAVWALGSKLPLRTNVSDDSAVASVQAVHLLPDGTRKAIALARVGVSWEGNAVLDAVGNHSFQYVAKDLFGNNASTAPALIQVRPIPPPEVALDGPADGAVVPASSSFRVNVTDTLPTLQVTVRGVAGNRTLWTKALDPLKGPLVFDLEGSPNGTLSISVEVMNNAGASRTVIRNVTVQAPVAQAVSTSGGAKESGGPLLGAIAVSLGGLAHRARRSPRSEGPRKIARPGRPRPIGQPDSRAGGGR